MLVCACAIGCGGSLSGARFVLEKPIAERCETAGLKACPQITDGLLLIAEGDKEGGLEKIRQGMTANEPDDFADFVAAMRLIGKIPGAGQYVAPINQVLALISTPASSKADRQRKHPQQEMAEKGLPKEPEPVSRPSERDSPARTRRTAAETPLTTIPMSPDEAWPRTRPAPEENQDLAKWDGQTIVPLLHAESRQCALGSPFSPLPETAKGRCVRARPGPLVVTDLHATGTCGADLFALAGSASSPRWIVYVPAGTSLHTSGSFLVVREHEFFVVGAVSSNENKLKGDVRCSLTWSGFRPSATDIDLGY